MGNLKHIGRVVSTGRKCLIAYRTLPGDAYNCLIIPTENLPDEYHDALINLVESPSGQEAYEFAEVLARSQFSDGSTMLPSLHAKGKLVKVPTDAIEIIPNNTTKILLSELNQLIAEQRGVPVDELSIKPDSTNEPPPASPVVESVVEEKSPLIVENLTPAEQARKYRSEADRLAKEAAKYRRLADELVPINQRRRTKKVVIEPTPVVESVESV